MVRERYKIGEAELLKKSKKSLFRYPNLLTVLMVEDVLRKNRDMPMKVSELKRKLPKKVMHQTLKVILDYLLLSGKIIIGTKGVQWIYAEPEHLRKMMEGGMEKINVAMSNLMQKIVEILKRNKVKRAGIFGSYARGEQSKDSDIDLLIEFDGSLLDLVRIERELKEKLKKEVDLLTYEGISPYLRKRILKEEVRIL